MGFDLSQIAGKEVVSASLVIHAAVTETAGDAARIDAHAVSGAWTEAGLTFSNRPGLGAAVGSMTLDKTSSYKTTDITSYVDSRAAVSAKTMSLGFTQDAPFLTGMPLITQLKSRESSNPPYIDVVLEQ
jgi:hypothetical protein